MSTERLIGNAEPVKEGRRSGGDLRIFVYGQRVRDCVRIDDSVHGPHLALDR